MTRVEVPPGWWGVFDCERCGLSVAVETLADAYALEGRHGLDRCEPRPPAEVVSLPRAAERRRCRQCGRMILPTPAGRLRPHFGGPGDGRPGDGRCYGTGQPVGVSS